MGWVLVAVSPPRSGFEPRRVAWALGLALLAAPAMAQQAGEQLSPEAARWASQGIAHYRQGRYHEAATALARARDLAPDHAEISNALGTSLLHADRYVPARAEFERFLARHPEETAPRLGLARIAVRLGDYEEATRFYGEVLSRRPGEPVALYNLAWLRYRAGEYAETRRLLGAMLERQPDHLEAHYTLGMACMRLGDADCAEKELRRAVELSPAHRKARFNLANFYLRAGRDADAARERAAFQQLADRFASDRALEGTARDRFLAEDYAGAMQEYDRLLKLNPGSGRFALGRGLCLLRMGKRTGAIAALEQAALLDPQLPDVHFHLAAVYQEIGDLERSRAARGRYEALEQSGVSQY